MSIDPTSLATQPNIIEDIEKASARMVCQAIWDFAKTAKEAFSLAKDLAGTVGEDITRDALDVMGVSRVPTARLIGKIDYKKAAYYFDPEYSVRQALLVDSKAEKGDTSSATIQTSQTSLRIRFKSGDREIDEQGQLETCLKVGAVSYLATTIFVKYHYAIVDEVNELRAIYVISLPNGMLQQRYNPTSANTIWRIGRNAPSRGEEFRVRINFAQLKAKQKWRVQTLHVVPELKFSWED